MRCAGSISGLLAVVATVAKCDNVHFYDKWYDIGLYGAYPGETYATFPLAAPRLSVPRWNKQCNDDYLTLLTPRGWAVPTPGPVILDARGNLVWMEERFGEVMDMKIQEYKGENYITFWSGIDDGTHGRGTYYMLNSKYEVEYEINPVGTFEGDLHEFKITSEGTALMTVYEIIETDLSAYGRSQPGYIYDGLFQEIDIETGELIFQWRATDHYKIHDSFENIGRKGYTRDKAFDFFHINSIDKDDLGNYYVSSRYMHSVTCISPNGEVLWILGGKHNSFTDLSEGAASNFSWQHHANWHPGNKLTIFDNGGTSERTTAEHSRALMISLELNNMTATLDHGLVHPRKVLSNSQGSVQILPETGNIFVGWGHSPGYTEYSPEGEVLCDIYFGSPMYFTTGWVKSYRTFKSNWVGRPTTKPSIGISEDRDHIYASWNGATEVYGWGLQVGDTEDQVDDWYTRDYQPRETFETKFQLPRDTRVWFRIVALDRDANTLGVSEVINRWNTTPSTASFRFSQHRGTTFFVVGLIFLGIALATVIGCLLMCCVCRHFKIGSKICHCCTRPRKSPRFQELERGEDVDAPLMGSDSKGTTISQGPSSTWSKLLTRVGLKRQTQVYDRLGGENEIDRSFVVDDDEDVSSIYKDKGGDGLHEYEDMAIKLDQLSPRSSTTL